MKTETKEPLEYFYKEMKAELLCSEEHKENLLLGLLGDIGGYVDDHPDATIEELHQRFGNPEVVGDSYQYSIGQEEMRNKVKKKRQLWYMIAFAMGMLVIIGLIFLAIFVTKVTDELPIYYVRSESVLVSAPEEILDDPSAVTVYNPDV